jgi:antitoxin component YwqK of YwqJK toxin-antitoxin module
MHTKSLFSFLLFTFFCCSINAQAKVFFNENWKETTKGKAVYYREVSSNLSKKEIVIDYFLSGEKAQETKYKDGKPDGKLLVYYKTGELKTIGLYRDGLKEDVWKTYDKKGKIIKKGRYHKGEKVGVWKTFYKNL